MWSATLGCGGLDYVLYRVTTLVQIAGVLVLGRVCGTPSGRRTTSSSGSGT
ncbi:hypothetical protein ACW23B_19140 [Streptomyces albidoflavus]